MLSKHAIPTELPGLASAREELCSAERTPDARDPDADVLALAGSGEIDGAICRLMERHGAAVYRYCREALRDVPRAAGVHHRVFIDAHRDLARCRRRASSVRVWLYAIAHRRLLDAEKQRPAPRRAENGAHGAEPRWSPAVSPAATAGAPPAEPIDDPRLQEALAASLDALPADARTALLLRFQQRFTFAEMAEICRQRPRTLRALVEQALRLLFDSLEDRIDALP